MNAPRATVNPRSNSVGIDQRLVTVMDLPSGQNLAICADRQGNEVRVPLFWQRSKGLLPGVGESWLLSQDTGRWIFSVFLGSTATQFPSGSFDPTWVNVLAYGADPSSKLDSTSAFAEALATGKWVYVPAGSYTCNNGPLNWGALNQQLFGDGADLSVVSSNGAPLLNMGPATVLEKIEIHHITLAATGAHLFTGANIKRSGIHDAQLNQNSAGFSIWSAADTTGVLAMYECRFERNSQNVYGGTRAVPAWNLITTALGTQVNQNVWRDNVLFNNNSDFTQPWYLVSNNSPGGQTQASNKFENELFEHPCGGMIRLLSCTGSTIDNCVSWDTSPVAIANSLFYMGKAASNPSPSGHNTIRNSGRRGGTFTGGAVDIRLESTCVQTTIENCGADAGGSAYNIDLGGSSGVVLSGLPANVVLQNASGTWATFASRGYSNSWQDSASGPNGRYRQVPVMADTVELIGDLNPGTVTDGTVIVNLPAAFHPLIAQPIPVVIPAGTPTGTWPSPRLAINTNGNLTCQGMAGLTGSSRVAFHGFYSLVLST